MAKADPADTQEARAARGARLHWARELVEPNRYEFARRLEVNAATIRGIESGRKNPSLGLLDRICRALRIDLNYVMRGSLSGVDAELAAKLLEYHPQLRPPRKQGRRRTDAPDSTLDPPNSLGF